MKQSNHQQSYRRRGVFRPSFLPTPFSYDPASRCGAICIRYIPIVIAFFLCSTFSLNTLADINFDDDFLEGIQKDYGEYPRRRLVGWQKLVDENKDLDELQKLEKVNSFFNLLEFRSDQSHWGERDYWATPLEFIVSGAGDCEDFSIAKYFTLRELGVPDEKMMITYVKAIELNQAHMVLTYYETPTSEPLVLDNLTGDIQPATKRTDLKPIYSFNGGGLWQAKQRGLGKKIGKSDDLNLWTDMEKRMKKGSIKKFR